MLGTYGQVLAALIDTIFFVMGEPYTVLRQCPLAMDKWLELVMDPILIMLDLIINTNKLTVAIPKKYVSKLCNLINSLIPICLLAGTKNYHSVEFLHMNSTFFCVV